MYSCMVFNVIYYNVFGLFYLGCHLFSELTASSEYFIYLFVLFSITYVRKHVQINKLYEMGGGISACIIGVGYLVN